MSDDNEGFWIVWCEDGGTPTVKHASFEDAHREAERLARSNKGRRFIILRAEMAVVTNDVRTYALNTPDDGNLCF